MHADRRSRAARHSADVVVVGAGIIGCAAAAIMADRGARVVVVEGVAVGAGASGRNLGAIQHPFDPLLAPLYEESLTRYRALADRPGSRFTLPAAPAGLLLLNRDADAARRQHRRLRRAFPELGADLLEAEDVVRLEPSLTPGPAAVRLDTGFPIPPASATEAWAHLAEEHGASIVVGTPGRPAIANGRAVGVTLEGGDTIAADAVLVAAGPWTPALVDEGRGWRPIHPTYGVTLQLRLGARAPRHVVEEDEVDAINRAEAATERAASTSADAGPDDPPSLFSLASAGDISTLGSTFLPTEPDPALVEPLLLRRAESWLAGIADAEIVGRRICARPQSVDGHPFIGAVPGTDGLHVCAGHGPWGISIGPATAAIAARALLDGTPPPPELAASRPF